jgi:hypothetical protein
VRISKKLITANMGLEFLHVLRKQLNISDEEEFNERDWYYDIKNFIKDDSAELDAINEFCICGKPIKKLRYIKYKPQNIFFQVGTDCIQKNLSQLYDLIKEDVKEYKKKQSAREKNRECKDCGEFNIKHTEPLYKTRCLECYKNKSQVLIQKDEEPLKECALCETRLSIVTPSWKTLCATCYQSSMKNARACNKCGEQKIGSHEPSYKTLCSFCYKTK